MKETDAIVTAIMDSGAVLSRVYTGGALGDWSSTGHILADGYMDDGTIITYERTALVNEYKDEFGNNLEEITKDKSSLEQFIKTNKE